MIAALLLLLAAPDGCIPAPAEGAVQTEASPLQESGPGLWIGGIGFAPTDIAEVGIAHDSDGWNLTLRFTASGAGRFQQAQRCGPGAPMELSLDGKLLARPLMGEPILGDNVWFPGLGRTRQDVEAVARKIGGGSMSLPPAMPDGDLASVSISLVRTQCFGRCPVYSVEIRGSGAVLYEGKSFVLVEGRHAYSIAPSKVRALLERFRNADFWALQGAYHTEVTDMPTQILVVKIGGETAQIIDYDGLESGMPEIIAQLEQAVDEVSGVARWVKGNGETLEGLERENWDFHSKDAATMLRRAAEVAPDRIVFGLIDRGADPDGDLKPDAKDQFDDNIFETPLEKAASMARLNVVRRLIAAGASTKGPWIQTALRGAVESEDPKTVTEILKYGPDVNAPVSGDYTALEWVEAGAHPRYDAPDADREGVIKLLIAAGAKPKAN